MTQIIGVITKRHRVPPRTELRQGHDFLGAIGGRKGESTLRIFRISSGNNHSNRQHGGASFYKTRASSGDIVVSRELEKQEDGGPVWVTETEKSFGMSWSQRSTQSRQRQSRKRGISRCQRGLREVKVGKSRRAIKSKARGGSNPVTAG